MRNRKIVSVGRTLGVILTIPFFVLVFCEIFEYPSRILHKEYIILTAALFIWILPSVIIISNKSKKNRFIKYLDLIANLGVLSFWIIAFSIIPLEELTEFEYQFEAAVIFFSSFLVSVTFILVNTFDLFFSSKDSQDLINNFGED